MPNRILIIDGHPDPAPERFCHALAAAYAEGAAAAGSIVRRIEVAKLDFAPLRTRAEWESGAVPSSLAEAQAAIGWAEHLVIVYPLWLGSMPALLRAFLEQVLRPGFAIARGRPSLRSGLLRGKSARIVVTMGMPALVYRWFFRAHGLKNLERNILGFCGIAPIRATLVGMVEAGGAEAHAKWLARLRALGAAGR
jgi:putative NADPH-quinone reductase